MNPSPMRRKQKKNQVMLERSQVAWKEFEGNRGEGFAYLCQKREGSHPYSAFGKGGTPHFPMSLC